MGTYAEGKSLWVNLPKRVVLHHFSFKKKVDDLQFSPDGKYFAVTSGRHVQVWQTPPMRRETGAFVLHRTYTGHYDDVTCIDWSADGRYARVPGRVMACSGGKAPFPFGSRGVLSSLSRAVLDGSSFFCAGSKDMTTRVYSLHPLKGFHPLTLSGHRDLVVMCQFAKDSNLVPRGGPFPLPPPRVTELLFLTACRLGGVLRFIRWAATGRCACGSGTRRPPSNRSRCPMTVRSRINGGEPCCVAI